MPHPVFGLILDADGAQDDLLPRPTHDTHATIAYHLGAEFTSHRLGLLATFHVGRPRHQLRHNQYAERAWQRLAGGSPAPAMRGSVIITGPARPDGSYADLGDREHQDAAEAADFAALSEHLPVTSAAQLQGGRRRQNDGHAVHLDRNTGILAWAVLDGIGDEEDVSAFVRQFTPRLARVGAQLGCPAEAIQQIRDQADREVGPPRWGDPSAVAVLALYHPEWPEIRIGWCGDARAYRMSHHGIVRCLTRDHNEAQALRDQGLSPDRDSHNIVHAYLGEGDIDVVTTERKGCAVLMLCSDGAYRPLEDAGRGASLGDILNLAPDPKDAAGELVAEAVSIATAEGGYADNATAIVIKLPFG